MKKGTFTKKGKPTRFAVELYLKYFELGGNITDKKVNPLISERLQQIMGWKDGQGIVCLLWGLHPKAKNAKKHSYHEPMIKAKELAWEIYNTCGL